MDSRDTWEVDSIVLLSDRIGEEGEEGGARGLPGFWLVQIIGWWCHLWRWGALEEDLYWEKVHEFSLGYNKFVISSGDVKLYIQM